MLYNDVFPFDRKLVFAKNITATPKYLNKDLKINLYIWSQKHDSKGGRSWKL